ncbi:MAG: hypothetical protein C4529_03100 [Deltaproteobacteria bacterium]|nr:MAG: hypothetical protein C4529_03100 [Deltaproteobacteria bacterium]
MERRVRTAMLLGAGLWLLGAWSAAAGHSHGPAGTPMEDMGERIFRGSVGPWNVEARMIDMNAELARSGVSAATIAKLSSRHHLVVILTDPDSGKSVVDAAGEVRIAGPDNASSSKVSLVPMGGHIGSDVRLPKAGRYRFELEAEGGGRRGSASFEYLLKP